jgi:hypothetical protein
MECFHIDTLRLHLDNALDVQMHHAMAVHLSICRRCADKLRTIQEDDARLRRGLANLKVPEVHGRSCYPAEALSAYVSGLLTAREAFDMEQHLHTCDGCLGEVMMLHKTRCLLQRESLLVPPRRLVTAVQQACTGAEQAQEAGWEKCGTLIIQVAKEGLRFVKATLLPAHVQCTVGGHLLPAPALRSTPEASGAAALLDIQQTMRELVLHIGVWHEDGETVRLKVQLYKQGRPLARQRVSLVSHGRLLYASHTSSDGRLTFPRLPPGEYTLRIPQEHVETQVILRSAGETPPAR